MNLKKQFGYPAKRGPLSAGFTLIELLVVVLIIGILSAVALPKYQKAVKRAQGVEARVAIKTWADAANMYYLENGEYPDGITCASPLEEVKSIFGVEIAPLKYFDIGCQTSDKSPIACGSAGCMVFLHPKTETVRHKAIICSVHDGKSINFDECGATVGTTLAEDYGIKQ